jgi:hypothetical protein
VKVVENIGAKPVSEISPSLLFRKRENCRQGPKQARKVEVAQGESPQGKGGIVAAPKPVLEKRKCSVGDFPLE